MNTLRLAWRNLFRNPRRTAITVTAVALNTAILVSSMALMEGMVLQMKRNATRLVTGDAQVHAPGYRADKSFYLSIEDPEAILKAADKAGYLAAPRSFGYGLVSSGAKSAGAAFWGIDPKAERLSFELAGELRAGAFLSDDAAPAPQDATDDGSDEAPPAYREVVIGRKLAKSLHADIGTELVTVVQAGDGSLGNELFKVVGILKSVGEEMDRGGVFIHRADFQDLFVSKGRVHEIAINAYEAEEPAVRAAIGASLKTAKPGGVDAELASWRKIMPAISDMLNMTDAAIFLFGIIFLLAAGLGVLNTMLMATHDRVREFGVLRALGCSRLHIVRDVAAEGFVLAVLATVIGVAIGWPVAWWTEVYGLDLTVFGDAEFSFSGIAWDPIWRGKIVAFDFIYAMVTMWIVCVIASLYPAVKAARLDPARAMTHV